MNLQLEKNKCISNFKNEIETIYKVEDQPITDYYTLVTELIEELKCSPIVFKKLIRFYFKSSELDSYMFSHINLECYKNNPDVKVNQRVDGFLHYEKATELIDELQANNIPQVNITSGGISMYISKNEVLSLKNIFSKYNVIATVGNQ
jgi:hypothetical protein